ncbi:MAG TPA: polysaccharide deacetylase family protein, partial [Nitrososphaera sp.]|nr:polysaccharide deacetylase family protein [Nitrososphaera sp.]
MASHEQPVFFDQTGKRWQRTKWIFALAAVATGVLLAIIVPLVTKPVALPASQNRPLSTIDDLQTSFNASNVPVIGQGQFIRAVEVERRGPAAVISDVFSGKEIRPLSGGEASTVSDSRYALERYGQLPDRQIVRTFDDGPDPEFTPRLLDILSRNQVPAAFFVVGSNIVKHPEIAQRMVRESHALGNHTFSHIDFEYEGTAKGAQEINQTQRVIRAATGQQTAFMRVPYGGNTDEAQRDNVKGILQAQRLGYVAVAYDYDTDDWKFSSKRSPDPAIFDGKGQIFLLHDSGGNRSYTIDYVEQLIPMAKKAGYSFVNLDTVYPGEPLQGPISPGLADKAAFSTGQAVLVWPAKFVRWLFTFSVLLTLLITGMNIVLATLGRRRRPPQPPKSYRPSVSLIIPAYNEELVLEQSVKSLLRSSYRNLSIVVVDDGSSDGTLEVARRLSNKYARVKVLHQPNRGKAAALN